MDRSPALGRVDRRSARPAHPSRPHPGDERRQLPSQAEPPRTDPIRRTLNSAPPNAPRGRRASSATLQSPFYPAYSTSSRRPTGLVLLSPSGLVLLRPRHLFLEGLTRLG